jgi:signal peptide peptidase SppA
MRKYGRHLLQTFSDEPSLVSPNHVGRLRVLAEQQNEGLIASLGRTLTESLGMSARQAREEGVSSADTVCAALGVQITDRNKPFIFTDGLAIIPMWGSLLHRDSWCDSYATGYDYIRRCYEAAVMDPDVQGIVFDVDSPGGHVAGNFELAEDIYNGRKKKPSIAIVDSMCYSGGYSLSSAADRIVVTQSGGVGSIGVVMMHASIEKMVKEWGIEITFIHAGAHKVDGNMFQKLPDDVRKRYQASVERSYDKFTTLVARNRGLSIEAVRATEALCYDAVEALSLGLIDAIQSPQEALATFRKELSGSSTSPQQGASSMSKNVETPGAGGENAAAPVAAPAANAPAAPEAAAPVAAAPSAPEAAAAPVDQKTRIAGIQTCDEAKGREELANHLAFNTEMSVDDAKKVLGVAPKAAAAKPADAFTAAMNNGEHPNVGATDGGEGERTVSVGERIAGNYHAATNNMHKREARKG